MTDRLLIAFAWRVLLLTLVSVLILAGLNAVGLFDHISEGTSGMVGIVMGVITLFVTFVWLERSDV